MARTLLALGSLLSFASLAAAQAVTGTFTVQGPNGEPIVVQGGIVGGVQGGIGVGVGGPGAGGQPRDNRPQTGTGRVRGLVTTSDGQPLRRAPVRLNGAPTPHVANTDIDGRYEFTDLPPGHFSVFASRAGYIGTQSDAFDLADNERRDNVNIRVPRGGVITGQVIDEFGEPVVGATVVPMRSQFLQGQQRLTGAGASTTTNDIGEYRIFGLSPGPYYRSVTARNESITINFAPVPGAPPTTSQSSSETGYAPTYYPGTPDISSAQRLTVAGAQTLSNVNIALVATRLARISGVAFDGNGSPLTRGQVTAMSHNNNLAGSTSNSSGTLKPDGTFSIANVAPGEYILRAMIQPAGPPVPPTPGAPPTPPQAAIAIITVSGSDVTDVVLAPVKPATLRGRVVLDDAAAAASIKTSTARVTVQRFSIAGPPLVQGPVGNATLKEDFTFEMQVSPELSNIRATIPVAPQQLMRPWRMKAVRVRGVDVIDTGLDIRPGEVIDDLEIEMTNKEQEVSGQVLDARGQPAKEFSLILFAQDPVRWTSAMNRYWAIAAPQPQGGYKMSSLPPGEYYGLAVTERQNAGEWSNPDFLEMARRSATAFSLREGETKTLDFKLSAIPTR